MARGARTAAPMSMPMTLMITCKTVVMMRLPPGLPVAITTRPSRLIRLGVIELSGRLVGATALAAPPSRP